MKNPPVTTTTTIARTIEEVYEEREMEDLCINRRVNNECRVENITT